MIKNKIEIFKSLQIKQSKTFQSIDNLIDNFYTFVWRSA